MRCNFEIPKSTPTGFTISMPGEADRWVEVSELEAMVQVERTLVLECAGNGRTFMEPLPEGTPWTLGGISPIEVFGCNGAGCGRRSPPNPWWNWSSPVPTRGRLSRKATSTTSSHSKLVHSVRRCSPPTSVASP